MTKYVFYKELNEIIRSSRFAWSTIIVLLLIVIGIINGTKYYTAEASRRNDAAEASYRQWLEQGEKNPHSAAHYGFYAYKPATPLTVLDKGLDDYLGSAVWLEAHYQNEAKARSISDKLSISRFGDLTVGLVLWFIIPLLILLSGFDKISGEKENGTLRILLSTRAGSKQILYGKTLAVFATSFIWLGACIIPVAFTLILLNTSNLLHSLLQLIIITGIVAVVFAVTSITIIAISAFSKNSSVALVSGVGVWIVAAILVPRLNGSLAEHWSPTPSAFAFQQAIDHDSKYGIDGKTSKEQRDKAFRDSVLKKFKVDSISQLPVNFSGLSLQAGEEDGNKVFDKNFSALFNTIKKQDDIISALSLLSPLMAGRNTLYGFSGNDISRHESFINQAETHRRGIQRLMNDDYTYGAVGKSSYNAGVELWSKVSRFNYIENSSTIILMQQARNIIVLTTWCVLAFIFLTISSKKLNPSIT